ncbi:MAG TPA: hypothetical protein VG125_03825 [Pirellulales bacterium]|jgi:hypothetical protein|nr:hypothetical protein [Pirellulales bacterium]
MERDGDRDEDVTAAHHTISPDGCRRRRPGSAPLTYFLVHPPARAARHEERLAHFFAICLPVAVAHPTMLAWRRERRAATRAAIVVTESLGLYLVGVKK